MSDLSALLMMTRSELARELAEGKAIESAGLENRIFRGISLGLPGWVDTIAWKTFAKAILRDPATGLLRGWNIRLEQTGITGDYRPKTRAGRDVTFGHFLVESTAGYRAPRPLPAGLLLDYGRGGNSRFDVTALVRDPLVALPAAGPGILLGWSYLDLGAIQLSTPSYFLLIEHGALDIERDAAAAPRPSALP